MIFLGKYSYCLYSIGLSLLLIYFIWQYFKARRSPLIESDLIIIKYVLDSIISHYKTLYFTKKYEALLSIHDLDSSSITNSFKKFNKEYEIILKESAKDIYANYITDGVKKTCLRYYTLDALFLQIISNLKD